MTDPWGVLFVAAWVLLAVVLVVGALRPRAEPPSRPVAPEPRPVPPSPRPSALGVGR